jgi:hypothetical protein
MAAPELRGAAPPAGSRVAGQIMQRGWSPSRQAFIQHYDGDVLDASLLLMPLCKFVAPTDPRWLSTLDAITSELVSDSLVYRYNVHSSPDGLVGDESTFSMPRINSWIFPSIVVRHRASGERCRLSTRPLGGRCTLALISTRNGGLRSPASGPVPPARGSCGTMIECPTPAPKLAPKPAQPIRIC